MIKNVSSTFKANCKKDSVKYREYIVIDNKQIYIKGNLTDTAYKDTTFFGKFNLKMLKFETENDINYKKKEFTYYKEVNGEAIKIGTFIVTDVSDSDTFESVNVTAYDYGLKFAEPYITKLNYSNGNITLFQVIQEICTNCEVELENTSLPNGAFIVDSNQFVNGEQYGDVVAQASGINGMFATINSNDKLEFIFTNETDEIIEDYVELEDKRDTHPITSVLVAINEDLETAGAVLKDEALIEQYGENWLKVYSYGFAYSTIKCQQLVEAIFNQVKGFGYSSFKSEYSFLPYLSLGDKIKFKNKEGKLVNSIILRYETNYDEITFEAPSIINAAVDYELPETPENTAKKAMIKANQIDGEVIINTRQINEIGEKLNNDYYEKEQVNELILNAEKGLTNTFTKVGGNNLLKNSALFFKTDNVYDFWTGNAEKIIYNMAQSNTAISLKKSSFKQSVNLTNDSYTISFKFEQKNTLGTASVTINNEVINLTESGEIKRTYDINNNLFEIEFNSTLDDSYIIYDLMLNSGTEASSWSQYQNEVHTDTVNISKGITIEATENDTIGSFGADGVKVENKYTNEIVLKATDTGIETTDTKSNTGTIGGISMKKTGNQSWIVGV